ncbi:MAG: hypothetical protein A4E59_00194 [Syntrophorhabdus sp. PtaB.Bin027]|nr:MAG: hypothetical protein A4E59_00194 [Syntrophorhabdus sp. PtaB.Bin027]OQB77743.1 MAG: hypothetical protein BWX92_00621 [Deltaproteobacteria bacterium ADurb.Bin135]
MTKISISLQFIIITICFFVPCVTNSETLIIYSDMGSETCRFDVEPAITHEEQARGLMFRKSLDDKAGMFFIFQREELRHFWMKNTLFPLDLVFIDNNFLVVDIHKNAKPLDESIISSRKPARYVLEIKAGKADKCRMRNGTKTKLLKNSF